MKKCLAAAALFLSVVLTLSGCFPTGEKDPTPDTSLDLSDNKLFEFSKNDLTASFEIPDTPDNIATRIRLKEKKFDTDEILDLFFSGKTIDPAATFEDHYWAYDKSFLRLSEDLNEIYFADGYSCCDMIGETPNTPVNYTVTLYYGKDEYREVYDIGSELEGFPVQSAVDRALELASKLGLTHLGSPKVYAFDVDTFEKIKKDTPGRYNEALPLTQDEEVYLLRFPQVFDGIELANSYSLQIDDDTQKGGLGFVYSPEVVVGVSKSDIYFFEAEEAYEAEYEILSSDPMKYDLNYALNELTSYLNRVYFNDPTLINNAKLVYFPVTRKAQGYVEFLPAWSFTGIMQEQKGTYTERFGWGINYLTDNGERRDSITR